MRTYQVFETSEFSGASWLHSSVHASIYCLHGFTGHYLDYEILVNEDSQSQYDWHSLSCPGHEGCFLKDPEDYNSGFLKQINRFISSNSLSKGKQSRVLVGYSMGGRYALRYALQYPNSIDALVLIGTNSGIDDENDRLDSLDRSNKQK